ncbi:hypothetical protein VTH06DRAFT_7653 [Thermothelomyces fergusii]
MDPTASEFRPRALAQPGNELQLRPNPSEDSRWRTTCRTCGAKFQSRNQLMRHLYKSHPGKPAKPKPSPPKTAQARVAPQPSVARQPGLSQSYSQSQSPSRVHPFALLSCQQQLAFAGVKNVCRAESRVRRSVASEPERHAQPAPDILRGAGSQFGV